MGWELNAGPYALKARDLLTEQGRCSFFCVRATGLILGEPPPMLGNNFVLCEGCVFSEC